MRIVCESVGGFTGPSGTERIVLLCDQLPAAEAAGLRDRVAGIPETAWGAEFRLASPRSWDFWHVLRVTGDDGRTRGVGFHEGAAPDPVRRLLEAVRAAT